MKLRLGLTGLIVLLVAGCGLAPITQGGADACPASSTEAQAFADEEHGYCLLYPSGYHTEQPNPSETVITEGSLQDVESPRVYIVVRDAGGRTAGEIAGGIVAELQAGLPNWSVRQSATRVGGETAVVLDNLPGQEIGRQVIVVHEGRVYTLDFVPAAPAGSEVVREMEQLYRTVVDSLRFTANVER